MRRETARIEAGKGTTMVKVLKRSEAWSRPWTMQIVCKKCDSELAVSEDDLSARRNIGGDSEDPRGTGPDILFWFICPVCGERRYLSEEVIPRRVADAHRAALMGTTRR